MTIIVADTSPVNYLILIGEIAVLQSLFGEIIFPPAVYSELSRPETPAPVQAWVKNLPPWAKIVTPRHIDPTIDLGKGENEAISLAKELGADFLLMDERLGRLAAKERGIKPARTLLILSLAHEQRLLNFDDAAARLLKTNFRVSPAVVEAIRRQFLPRESNE